MIADRVMISTRPIYTMNEVERIDEIYLLSGDQAAEYLELAKIAGKIA